MQLREVVCGGGEDPYGVFNGKLREYDAVQRGALAIKEVMRRVEGKVKGEDVDYVFMARWFLPGPDRFPAVRLPYWPASRIGTLYNR